MKQIKGKLVSTSDESLTQRIGRNISIKDITHGDNHFTIDRERAGRVIIITINYRSKIYELQEETQKFSLSRISA